MLIQRALVRPSLEDLIFYVYARSLHPELFEVVASRQVERRQYTAKVEITSAGHVLTWHHRDVMLTEVTGSIHQKLPELGRLAGYRFRGQRDERVHYGPQVTYRYRFQVEPVKPELLFALEKELGNLACHQGLFCRFEPGVRFGLPPISYALMETRDRHMLVRAFHTFPDECIIVKVQSEFSIG